jgi:hypothetical protein
LADRATNPNAGSLGLHGCCSNGDEPATQYLHFRLVPLDWL